MAERRAVIYVLQKYYPFQNRFQRQLEKSIIRVLQYMEMRYPKIMLDETMVSSWLRSGSNDEADWSLRRGTGASGQAALSGGKWSVMERLIAVRLYVNVLRAYHAIIPFLKRNPWPLQIFYRNRFHRDSHAYPYCAIWLR